MLEPLKRVVRRSPLAGPVRRLYRRIWPLTTAQRNDRYDFETEAVMARVLAPDSICLDIGAHTGSVLRHMVRLAPQAQHRAFEPLPIQAAYLRAHFPEAVVHEVALAETAGLMTFQHAVQNPAYSGLKRRGYPGGAAEVVETITVQTARLDDLVLSGTRVRLIKVDVEGGELGVFRGGQRVLAASRPVIVFEHGQDSAAAYGSRPEQVYAILSGCGLAVTTMQRWLRGQAPLSGSRFVRQVTTGADFYYMAYPR